MKMSWQTETDHLMCRWYNGAQRVRYDAPWIQEAAKCTPKVNVSSPVLPFTRLSSLGWSGWYAPDCPR